MTGSTLAFLSLSRWLPRSKKWQQQGSPQIPAAAGGLLCTLSASISNDAFPASSPSSFLMVKPKQTSVLQVHHSPSSCHEARCSGAPQMMRFWLKQLRSNTCPLRSWTTEDLFMATHIIKHLVRNILAESHEGN